MGMTIEEALEILDNIPTIGEQVDALEMAIETMRKYQKIQEIVTKWHNDMSVKTSMAMTEIEEVIEDGKEDTT